MRKGMCLVQAGRSDGSDEDVGGERVLIRSRKSRDALTRLRDRGIYPTMPRMFGVRCLGGKRVEIDPGCAECIRFIYDNILKCRPYSLIIDDVNRRYGHLFKGRCHPSSFRSIATQPFYCGYMRNTDGVLIPALQMEGRSVVSYEVWQDVQRLMERKRSACPRARLRCHPFTGLIHCANCGAKLVSGMDGEREFYFCAAGPNPRRGQECRGSRVNIDLVRGSERCTGLRDALRPVLALALYRHLDDERAAESEVLNLTAYEAKLAEAEKDLSRGLAAYTEGDMDENGLRRFAVENMRRRGVLREKIARARSLANSDPTKSRFHRMRLGKLEDLLDGNIGDGEYELLLRRAVNDIVSADDRVVVDTVYGKFRLDRYMDGKHRNFPKYTWRRTECAPGERDLARCSIDVTYLYGSSGQTRILKVDFGHMRIYEQR